MSRKGLALTVALAAVAAACGASAPEPVTADAHRASKKWPATTLEDLTVGRNLFMDKCNQCHGLKDAKSVPAAQWSATVQRMRHKHGMKIPENDAQLIIRYLYAMARRPD
jgi:cytochrome c5